MALVGFIAGLVFAVVGALGVVAPSLWLRLGVALASPLGVWFIVLERLLLGVVFVGAAPRSRDPTLFRLLGAVTLVAGLAVPFLGLQTFTIVPDVWPTQTSAMARWYAAGECAFGLLIAYGIIPREAR